MAQTRKQSTYQNFTSLTFQKNKIENITKHIEENKRIIESINNLYIIANITHFNVKKIYTTEVINYLHAEIIRFGLKIEGSLGLIIGIIQFINSIVDGYKFSQCWYNKRDKIEYYSRLTEKHSEVVSSLVNYCFPS